MGIMKSRKRSPKPVLQTSQVTVNLDSSSAGSMEPAPGGASPKAPVDEGSCQNGSAVCYATQAHPETDKVSGQSAWPELTEAVPSPAVGHKLENMCVLHSIVPACFIFPCCFWRVLYIAGSRSFDIHLIFARGSMQSAVRKIAQTRRVAQVLQLAKAEADAKQTPVRHSTQFSVAKRIGRPFTRIHMVKILELCVLAYLGLLALFVKVFSPSLFWMFLTGLAFLPLGVGLSYMFHSNVTEKVETREKV